MGSFEPGRIEYTSALSAERRTDLEDLLFFNERQADYRDAVVESIERYGEPRIRDEGGFLRVHTEKLGEVQTLFAVEHRFEARRPVAAAVYGLTDPGTVTVLHVGVHPEFSATGRFASAMVTVRLVQEIARAAARIKNLERVVMPYGLGRPVTIALPGRRVRGTP